MQALAEALMTIDRKEARAKVVEYRKSVKDRHEAEDAAILRGYRAIAKGHAVIDLPYVIRLGGVFTQTGLPKLAISTADQEFVRVDRDSRGHVTFSPEGNPDWRRTKDVYHCPDGTLPQMDDPKGWKDGRWWGTDWRGEMRAIVPHVPPALRPLHHLRNYAVLFEVEEWAPTPEPPVDPALLKHLGGDLYAVLATWDLTPLEQAVMKGRIRG